MSLEKTLTSGVALFKDMRVPFNEQSFASFAIYANEMKNVTKQIDRGGQIISAMYFDDYSLHKEKLFFSHIQVYRQQR